MASKLKNRACKNTGKNSSQSPAKSTLQEKSIGKIIVTSNTNNSSCRETPTISSTSVSLEISSKIRQEKTRYPRSSTTTTADLPLTPVAASNVNFNSQQSSKPDKREVDDEGREISLPCNTINQMLRHVKSDGEQHQKRHCGKHSPQSKRRKIDDMDSD